MIDTIAGYIPVSSRQKIYLILVFVSLILFFYGVWQVSPVIVEVEAPLGLASYLPLFYWLGLAFLVITSILAFLDRELESDAIYITVLMALGLFLLGIRVFIEANAVDPTAYYPTAEVKNLLADGHLNLANPPHIASYYAWPAIHFISVWLLEVTGLDLISIIKYTPLFWIVCFVFITYGIGKRLKLESGQCFLLSFLAVSSWFLVYAGLYYARFPATVLFLLIFMLLIVPRRTVAEILVLIVMFASLVLAHGLTAVAVLPGLILLALYRREPRLIVLFIVIFGAWYLYQATTALGAGIQAFTTPLKNIFELMQAERYQVTVSSARLASRYSELGFAALYIALMVGSIILLLRRKITGERRHQAIALFCWATGVGLIVLWGHGEVVFRTFILCSVPALCIVVMLFSFKKLILLIMCLFIILSPLANYSGLAGWGQVLTTELKGTEFFALAVKPQDSYFYGYTNVLVLYNDPDLVTIPCYSPPYLARWPEEVDLSIMDRLSYVLISKLESDRLVFSWEDDPYATWPKTKAGRQANFIYDNGSLQIYKNRLAE